MNKSEFYSHYNRDSQFKLLNVKKKVWFLNKLNIFLLNFYFLEQVFRIYMENIQIQATNDLLDIEDSQDVLIFQPYKLFDGNKKQRLKQQTSEDKQIKVHKQRQLLRNRSQKLRIKNKTSCQSYRDRKQNSTSWLKGENKCNQHTSSKENLKFALQKLIHAGQYQQYGQKQNSENKGSRISMKRLKTAIGIREQSSKNLTAKGILKCSNKLNNARDGYAFNNCSTKYPSHNFQAFLSQETSQQEIFRPIVASRQKSSNTTLSTMTKLSFHQESQKIRKFIKRKMEEKTEVGIESNKDKNKNENGKMLQDKQNQNSCLKTRETKNSRKGKFAQNQTNPKIKDNKISTILTISEKNTPKISKSSKILNNSRSPKFRLTVKCRGKENMIASEQVVQGNPSNKYEVRNLRDLLF